MSDLDATDIFGMVAAFIVGYFIVSFVSGYFKGKRDGSASDAGRKERWHEDASDFQKAREEHARGEQIKEEQARQQAEFRRRQQEEARAAGAEQRRQQEAARAEDERQRRYRQSNNEGSGGGNSRNIKDEIYYGKVLGLKGKLSLADVRKNYIYLVSQYHPDKASHLGPKLREAAEIEMKEINEAFEYFKKKYR